MAGQTRIVADFTSIQTGIIGNDQVKTDAAIIDGTLTASPTALAVDDVISIAMTVTSAVGASGAYAWAEIEEVGV